MVVLPVDDMHTNELIGLLNARLLCWRVEYRWHDGEEGRDQNRGSAAVLRPVQLIHGVLPPRDYLRIAVADGLDVPIGPLRGCDGQYTAHVTIGTNMVWIRYPYRWGTCGVRWRQWTFHSTRRLSAKQ